VGEEETRRTGDRTAKKGASVSGGGNLRMIGVILAKKGGGTGIGTWEGGKDQRATAAVLYVEDTSL